MGEEDNDGSNFKIPFNTFRGKTNKQKHRTETRVKNAIMFCQNHKLIRLAWKLSSFMHKSRASQYLYSGNLHIESLPP